MALKIVLKHTPLRVYLLSGALLTNMFIYFKFIAFSCYRTNVCFYIISYTIINCITTVYRSYRADTQHIVVLVAIRIAKVVVSIDVAFVHIVHAPVSITRVHIHRARSNPQYPREESSPPINNYALIFNTIFPTYRIFNNIIKLCSKLYIFFTINYLFIIA